MPIYAYKCASCGHTKDVLQKMSDDPLSVCPQCGASAFSKQLTAPGFQLKGTGWYATDFKGGAGAAAAATPAADASTATPAAAATADSAPAAATATSTSTSTPCGGSCACH